ncbi:beta-1,3-galactosyltransferase 5 [Nilaparvata lugens]|uniref:beta-1,3-galactosyltransferase 5 n=1 Tax=Nilaparvata lugens TaxID=108931 RepID=UPI000B98F229|nr:beta-1,3-galactosyltransferase 5 [Nilaparvata lugens]
MMAFRVRVLHSLILGLVGLTFILYSSYYSNPVQVYRLEDVTLNSSKASSVATSASASPSPSQEAAAAVAVDNPSSSIPTVSRSTPRQVVPSKVVEQKSKTNNIQKIEPHSAKNGDYTLGILTERLYESGHDIASVELCPDLGDKLKLLVAITSAPQHQEARMAIRQTWGHYGQRSDISIGFLLGLSSPVQANAHSVDANVRAEADLYGDIIRSRFIDSYDNLTLKTVSLTEWVDNFCTKVQFVLKTDDDMFINIPRLLVFINEHSNQKRIIYGRLAKKWKPIRNIRSKYFVSARQFSPPVFPDFVTGPAYLLSGDVMHDLYTNSLGRNYLKLEDVYTTGIVAEAINVSRIHVNEFLNKRIPFNPCNIKKSISIHMIKYHEQYDLWKKLLDGRSKCK